VRLIGTRVQGSETASQGTAVDTARELLSERETAPVRMEEMEDVVRQTDIQRRRLVQTGASEQ